MGCKIMAKGKLSAMGSSKYENNPEKLDQDNENRQAFLEEIDKGIRGVSTQGPVKKYEDFYSNSIFFWGAVFHKAKIEGHTFALTFEGFKERGLLLCAAELKAIKSGEEEHRIIQKIEALKRELADCTTEALTIRLNNQIEETMEMLNNMTPTCESS